LTALRRGVTVERGSNRSAAPPAPARRTLDVIDTRDNMIVDSITTGLFSANEN